MHSGLYLVMGVCGSGKTVIGALFARALGIEFAEGDAYHSPENVARNADGWSEDERLALAGGAVALIAEPRFAHAFAPGSQAEVSIVGRLDRPRRSIPAGQRGRCARRSVPRSGLDLAALIAAPRETGLRPQGTGLRRHCVRPLAGRAHRISPDPGCKSEGSSV